MSKTIGISIILFGIIIGALGYMIESKLTSELGLVIAIIGVIIAFL